MDCNQMRSRAKQQQQQQESSKSISNHLKEICKSENSKGLLVLLFCCFLLLAFTVYIIFKGPANSDGGVLSAYFDVQSPNQDVSNTNISEEFIKISQKNHTFDKLLGGLLPPGLEESLCLSRYQWNLHRRPPSAADHHPSPYLVSKLRDYEALHKQCGTNTSPYNAAVEFLHKNNSQGGGNDDVPGCKYIIWITPAGLGNRMLSLASTFLYALLTNRVLLLRQEHGGDMSDLFCEPFPASSWLLPPQFSYSGYNAFNPSFQYRFGNMVKSQSLGKSVPPIMYMNLNNHYGDNDQRFFCDEDQTHLLKVTWMMIASNQYFLPSIFSISSFKQELDKLFPEKQTVFHHLGRYLFHPTNPVWGLITRYYDSYLSQADEIIGIQIRVFDNRGKKGPLKHVLDQILGCTTIENLLPKLQNHEHEENKEVTKRLAVLVTSLRSGYYEELRNMYWQNATISGEVVAFYQPSHEELQRSGNRMHDMKALTEIYLLSLTDKLLISGWSTFGYVAYSLGGLQPWILHPESFCKHSSSMEPCFHFPPSNSVCGSNLSSTKTYFKHCEDANTGFKLFD